MQTPLKDSITITYIRCCFAIERHQRVILLLAGIALLLNGTSGAAYAADGAGSGYSEHRFQQVCKAVLKMHEGQYGSLLSAASGLGAIIASAMGGFKMAWGLLIVSTSSFLLEKYETLWFTKC